MLVSRCWWQAAAMYAKTRCMCAGGHVSKVTRGGTRTRNLLLRREAPYPLGHTSLDLEVVLHGWPNRLGPAGSGRTQPDPAGMGPVLLDFTSMGLVLLYFTRPI